MEIVHCDVKMANVLVEERDGQHRGILTDFDLSKDDDYRPTTIEFAEFKNWRIHSVTAGKTVSVALVREAALDEVISSTTGIKFWR